LIKYYFGTQIGIHYIYYLNNLIKEGIMKKLTLTLVLGILLLNVTAFGRMSELNLRLNDYSSFNVVFDNRIINNNASSYDILNLNPGYHFLKVIEIPAPIYGNRGRYNRSPRILFTGNVYIGANRRVYAMIDAFNRFVVIREEIFRDNYGYNDHNNRYDDKYGHNKPKDKYNNDYGYNNNDRNYGKNNYGNNNYYAMSPNDFNSLKQTIANATFESTRYSIAKSAANLNRFTSQQVLELLYLFTYESTRLDFAKLAYYSVIDKEKFFIVYDAFTFSSSVDELSRYISR
jgi:hypothetical protein